MMFQSTPPRGERLRPRPHSRCCPCFNPRPRAGSDLERPGRRPGFQVSIHAPARGATLPSTTSATAFLFQSTPPRGERPGAGPWPCRNPCFNPRPRAGSDLALDHFGDGFLVSIHAPARGATIEQWLLRKSRRFQSTPPRGERLCRRTRASSSGSFQSTPPRGERPKADKQPTKREVSIHAPARGATIAARTPSAIIAGFNPRPRAGSDEEYLAYRQHGGVSIHAPARGATLLDNEPSAG